MATGESEEEVLAGVVGDEILGAAIFNEFDELEAIPSADGVGGECMVVVDVPEEGAQGDDDMDIWCFRKRSKALSTWFDFAIMSSIQGRRSSRWE